jgi:hypothetical protein
MAEEEVKVKVVAESAGFTGKMQAAAGAVDDFGAAAARAEKQASGFSAKLGAMAQGMLQGVGQQLTMYAQQGLAAVGSFVAGSVASASNLIETQGKINIVMGSSAKAITEWSQTSVKALTMTRTEALNAAASFGIFGKSAGLSGPALSNFSTNLVQLAADLASFHNTSIEQATTALSAALRGESEPIRAYGVLLDDASLRQKAFALGITDTVNNVLTPQQRVLAANVLIMEQTRDAQGDLARTGGNLAGQQRMLTANMGELSTVIGMAFLPAMTEAVTATNLLATEGMPQIKSWADQIGASIGKTVGDVATLAEAINRLANTELPTWLTGGGVDVGGAAGAVTSGALNAMTGGIWPLIGAGYDLVTQKAEEYNNTANDVAGTSERMVSTAQAQAQAMVSLGSATGGAVQPLSALQLAAWSATLGLNELTLAARIASSAMDAMAGRMAGNRAAIEGMFLGATDILGAAGAAAAAAAADVAFLDYHASLVKQYGGDSIRIKAEEKVWIDNQNKSLTDQRDAINANNRAATAYATEGLNAIKKKYEDIKSKASSVLSESLNTGVSMNPGPAKDAINENAKRLMAIANEGLQDQSWLEEFKAEVPDIYKAIVESGDPQGAARTFAEQFQMGMVPQLLDRDQAKQRIKDLMLGEAKMSQLAEELATEISQETGTSLSDALGAANKALGVDKTSGLGSALPDALAGSVTPESMVGVGTAIATGTSSAIAVSGLGLQSAASITSSFNAPAAVVALQDAGAAAFRTWWDGWKTEAGKTTPPIPDSGASGASGAGGVGTAGTLGGKPIAQVGNVYVTGVSGTPGTVGAAVGYGVLGALRKKGL